MLTGRCAECQLRTLIGILVPFSSPLPAMSVPVSSQTTTTEAPISMRLSRPKPARGTERAARADRGCVR
jgi:hypothetical protein